MAAFHASRSWIDNWLSSMHSFVRALGMDGLQQDTASMNLATLMDAYRRPLARQMCL